MMSNTIFSPLAQENFNRLLPYLQGALQLLDGLECSDSKLIEELNIIVNKLFERKIVMTVFAPSKYGKSTFLNAWLGEEILPRDVVPSTGTAIKVKYGQEPMTYVQFADGRQISEKGTGILSTFAVLEKGNRLRRDIKFIEVFLPHPLLKRSSPFDKFDPLLNLELELVDLPGTNSGFDDPNGKDDFIQKHLLETDIVIQLVNAEAVFTQYERQTLKNWLVDKGITSVIFVVNFTNTIKRKEDQNKAWERARSLAQNFNSQLPRGVNNLYRVDALPALEAQLYQDSLHDTGLPEWKEAMNRLTNLFPYQVTFNDFSVYRLRRLQIVTRKIRNILENQKSIFEDNLKQMENNLQAETLRQQRLAQQLGIRLKSIDHDENGKAFIAWSTHMIYGLKKTVEGLKNIESLSTETFTGKVTEDYYLKNMFKSKD